MIQVGVDIKAAQNAAGEYLLSHENQIKYVSRRLCNVVSKSLLFTSKAAKTLGNPSRTRNNSLSGAPKDRVNQLFLGKITDIVLYSWYEAHVLLPSQITAWHSHKPPNSGRIVSPSAEKRQQSPRNDMKYADCAVNLTDRSNKTSGLKRNSKCICSTANVCVEKCWFSKLPPINLPEQKHIDLDKVYVYKTNDSDIDDEESSDNITYKVYDFNNKKWIHELQNHYTFSRIKDYDEEDDECYIMPSLKSFIGCKSFSIYEENVKYGGWPIHCDEMELGVWVYITPFIEHCAIDIPTQYLCQVQHMHKKMFKDVEPSRIILWCKKYNYESPDFINTDSEDDLDECKNIILYR